MNATAYATADRARLDERIAHGPEHLRPIMLAVRDHGCAFAVVTQGHHRFDIPPTRPTIVFIGDDMHAAHGPGGFHRKSLRRLLARCRAIVIVSTGPMLAAYASAAASSVRFGTSTAIIETRLEQEVAWLDFVKEHAPDAAVLVASVEPMGGVH